MSIRNQSILMWTVIFLFFITSIYSLPQADDIAYALHMLKKGFWKTQIDEYFNWNGRYIATAILSTNPLSWGHVSHFKFYPMLLIILIYLSSYFFSHSVFKDKLQKNERNFLALSFSFLYLMGLPTIAQGIYWLSGAYTYVTSFVVFNFCFGFYHLSLKNKKYLIPTILSAIILIGLNETSMVLWLFTLGMFEFFYYLDHKKIRTQNIMIFLISLSFAILVIKAPGNSIRASNFEKSHQIIRTVSNSLLYSILDPFRFLTISLLGFSFLNWDLIKKVINVEFLEKRKWWIVGFFMLMIFISFAPSFWGMGRRPNQRTLNVIYQFYLLGFYPLVFCFIKYIPKKLTLIAPFLLVFSMNLYDLAKDYISQDVFYYTWRKDPTDTSVKFPRSLKFSELDLTDPQLQQILNYNPDFFK